MIEMVLWLARDDNAFQLMNMQGKSYFQSIPAESVDVY